MIERPAKTISPAARNRVGTRRRVARRVWVPLVLLGLPMLALLAAPEGYLACANPLVRERSPDRAWTLTLCRRPMLFAMPGGGSDAPGWIVLRDTEGAVRGVVDLDMLQMYGAGGGGEALWTETEVVVPMVAELPLRKASGPVTRWLDERVWRLRALLGLTPDDAMFR